MTHLSLFTGIGGLDLAAEWAGFETVGQCEWADYPTKILEKHWPDVPRWRDIRTLTRESFYERTGRRTVDILSGGFPCQPFSVAGKQRGTEDDRYLWPEMLRVAEELQPRWVVGENVAGIVNMALDQVLSDLEAQGYTTGAVIVPACAVDAPHRRDRVSILAHAGHAMPQGWGKSEESGERPARREFTPCGKDVAHADNRYRQQEHEIPTGRHAAVVGSKVNSDALGVGQQGKRAPEQQVTAAHGRTGISEWYGCDGGQWPAEPDVGRVADGVPDRVDRLKCLGNAVVPQQFYPIFKAIAMLEEVQDI